MHHADRYYSFLFTDIEGIPNSGSVSRGMRFALTQHDTVLRTAIEAHNGYIFKTRGIAFCAAFLPRRCSERRPGSAVLPCWRRSGERQGPSGCADGAAHRSRQGA